VPFSRIRRHRIRDFITRATNAEKQLRRFSWTSVPLSKRTALVFEPFPHSDRAMRYAPVWHCSAIAVAETWTSRFPGSVDRFLFNGVHFSFHR
jgi:hypothetical protein